MQITAELDSQHLEKLQALEKSLKKDTSEIIAIAIDEVFTKTTVKTEGQKAYELMQQSGFIGSMEDVLDLSENYKDYLDWSDNV
jgi:predicted transcriptional regulator